MKAIKLGMLGVVALLVASPSYAFSEYFGVHGGINWGIGKGKNSTGSTQSRTLNTIGIQALPGYKLSTGVTPDFLIGPLLEYTFVGQNTEPSSVGNSNLRGSGYMIGLGVQTDFGPIVLLGSFDFIGQYSLSENTTAGLETKFKSPIGFRLLAGYPIMPMMTADLMFSMHSYKTNVLGGSDVDISSNKLTRWTVALGVSTRL